MPACFAIALDTQMKHGSVRASVFVDNFVKMISHDKSFIWNFFGNLVNKADGKVNDFSRVYCKTAYKVAK